MLSRLFIPSKSICLYILSSRCSIPANRFCIRMPGYPVFRALNIPLQHQQHHHNPLLPANMPAKHNSIPLRVQLYFTTLNAGLSRPVKHTTSCKLMGWSTASRGIVRPDTGRSRGPYYTLRTLPKHPGGLPRSARRPQHTLNRKTMSAAKRLAQTPMPR